MALIQAQVVKQDFFEDCSNDMGASDEFDIKDNPTGTPGDKIIIVPAWFWTQNPDLASKIYPKST